MCESIKTLFCLQINRFCYCSFFFLRRSRCRQTTKLDAVCTYGCCFILSCVHLRNYCPFFFNIFFLSQTAPYRYIYRSIYMQKKKRREERERKKKESMRFWRTGTREYISDAFCCFYYYIYAYINKLMKHTYT